MNFTIFTNIKTRKGEPLSSSELKLLLDKNLTSKLKEIGFKNYDGEYLWYSDINIIGVRLVFKYIRLKGDSGVFNWGYCFDFLPTISNTKKLKNHKTNKSITLHLWESTEGYKKSFEGGGRPTEIVSHYSDECENEIHTIYNKYKNDIIDWSKHAFSLQKVHDIALNQINKSTYNMHSPNPKYIYPFILAKLGKKEEGLELINEFFKEYIKYDESWKIVVKEIGNRIKSY